MVSREEILSISDGVVLPELKGKGEIINQDDGSILVKYARHFPCGEVCTFVIIKNGKVNSIYEQG